MPNEAEGKDSIQREQGTKGWQSQERPGQSERRQGNHPVELQRGRQPRFEGHEP